MYILCNKTKWIGGCTGDIVRTALTGYPGKGAVL